MSRAGDQEILAWAVGENATVVTLDADFHSILAVSGFDCAFCNSTAHAEPECTYRGGDCSKRGREVSGRTGTWVDGDSESKQDHYSQAADRWR